MNADATGQPALFLACDLGAESGRVMLARLADGRLTLEEIHRFPNRTIRVFNTVRWDLLGLFGEILQGLGKAARHAGLRNGDGGDDVAGAGAVRGVSVDSWGVDYVLFNARQPMLAPAFCYRDARVDPFFQAITADGGKTARIFAETGIQPLPFNTLFQLLAEQAQDPEALAHADGFLLVADYLHFLLCGVARAEESLASTTGLFNPVARGWSAPALTELGLPARVFPALVPSGTVLGPLAETLAAETGLPPGVPVIASCSHDTAAAVAAVPAWEEGDGGWAYLVSGTWSLLGLELDAPRRGEDARAAGFTNEVGFGGSIRFLKNIAGLWLLQEARREWAGRGEEFSYAELAEAAATDAEPWRSLVQPNAARFGRPGGMLGKIAAFCEETGQPAPGTPGEFARCIFDSLALLYRQTLADAERLTGRAVSTLHIVGGGSRNVLLNQLTADAVGRPVRVGPAEATAAGNALAQAIAVGAVRDLREARRIVAASFPAPVLLPADTASPAWDRAAERFSIFQTAT